MWVDGYTLNHDGSILTMLPMRKTTLALLAALTWWSSPGRAENGAATDRAFAALLTQPAAAPQTGQWILPDADNYRGWNEDRLIRWLAVQQKAGADFNAYRHFGTLLHHAIRAGLDRTALWLLQHGANPQLKVKIGATSGTLDALELSIDRKRPRVARALRSAPFNMTAPKAPPAGIPAKALKPVEVTGQYLVRTPNPDIAAIRRYIRELHLDLYPEPDYRVYEPQLQSSLATSDPVLQHLGPARLKQALDDDQTLEHWLARASVMPVKDFRILLQPLDAALLQRHARAALTGMSLHSHVDFAANGSQGHNPVHPDNWKALLTLLPGPLNQPALPPLLAATEPDLWPPLFRRGYRPGEPEAELARFLPETPPEPLTRLWPELVKHMPTLPDVAIPLMLAPFRPEGESDCRWEWTSLPAGLPAKVEYLQQHGAASSALNLKPPCMRHSPAEVTAGLLRLKVITPLAETAEPVLVPVPDDDCRFTLSDPVYRMLYRNPVIGSDRSVYASAVSLMAIPGEENCGLRLSGDEVVDPYIGGEQDNFDGPTIEPSPSCPDPTDATALYRLQPDQPPELLETPAQASYLLTPVRDTRNNRRYWLSYQPSGRCHSSEAALLEWQTVQGKPALVAVDVRATVWQAFEQQCDPTALEECPAFKDLLTEPEDAATQKEPDFRRGGALAPFINAHRAREREAYLKALDDLDKPLLKQLEGAGVPPFWTLEAMKAVSDSSRPLADKRKRLAWLMKDPAQLREVFRGGYLVNGSWSGLLESLATWLPAEDWTPLLRQGISRADLRDRMKERGQDALACAMDRAMGLNCGETWSATDPEE